MKKLIFASALLAAAMTSCNDDVEPVSQEANSLLHVTASVEGNMSRVSTEVGWNTNKTSFVQGDAIGLFVYQNVWGNTYNGVSANVKGTKVNNAPWKLDPAVNMTKDMAQIWAYYPYDISATDGKAIPVDLTKDYMWGTNGTPTISTAHPEVEITMKHALTQFALRLQYSPEYKNQGKLTKIELKSDAAVFATEGLMNVTNGTITGKSPALNITYPGLTAEFPKTDTTKDYVAMLFPMTAPTVGGVTMYLTIDGVVWKYKFAAHEWEAGNKNVYTLKLKSDAIVIGGKNGSDIKIEPWTESTNGAVELTPAN